MSIEAMKQMVEAIEADLKLFNIPTTARMLEALNAGRQAIAEAEKQEVSQEIVGALTLGGIINTSDGLEYEGWDVEWDTKVIEALQEKLVTSDRVELMLYTRPQPKREWVGLTEQKRVEIAGGELTRDERMIAIAIEAELKKLNT